ncbi:hypothetical protein [Caulobacter segnis]|uniref:Uncharacterized protein n=1 Tax=Caulobacter segnis TaxID=88688 RepID=A0A2W5XH10_9CAUL|nr:hypothetical protein [Caulobacter segnis]PZR37171.1 MAG: hypothetical protein DI526_01250 [Caulobacter segnis]
MKQDLAAVVHDFGFILVSGFLGAIVSLAYMPGLTWRQQIAATLAGGFTASFVCWALQDWLHLSAAVAGGLSFVVGLVAFRATPSLVKAVADSFARIPDVVAQLGQALAERIRTFGGKA